MKCVCNNLLLLTLYGASISSYSIKPFTEFDSFLSCSRLSFLAACYTHPLISISSHMLLVSQTLPSRCCFCFLTLYWHACLFVFLNFVLNFVCILRNISNISLSTTASFLKICEDTSRSHLTAQTYFWLPSIFSLTKYFFSTFHLLFHLLFSFSSGEGAFKLFLLDV